MSCRGIISSTVEVTSGIASRLYNWVTSPFRAEPEVKPEDQEENEDNDEERSPSEDGEEGDPSVPDEEAESEEHEAKPEAEEVRQ